MDKGAQTGAGNDLAQDFVRFAVESGVLRFGEFKTKAGRLGPHFFNAGLFDGGGAELGGQIGLGGGREDNTGERLANVG